MIERKNITTMIEQKKNKMYAYYFVLEEELGAGTWITKTVPKDSNTELKKRFENRKIKKITLLN